MNLWGQCCLQQICSGFNLFKKEKEKVVPSFKTEVKCSSVRIITQVVGTNLNKKLEITNKFILHQNIQNTKERATFFITPFFSENFVFPCNLKKIIIYIRKIMW